MPLLIVDINGTITRPLNGTNFTPEQQPTEIGLIPGVLRSLHQYKDLGYDIIGASNQGGIAAGHRTLWSVITEMQYTLTLTKGLIDCILFCPDFEGKECYMVTSEDTLKISDYRLKDDGGYRKPQPGMITLARCWVGADKLETTMVGDLPEDEKAAKAAGVKFMPADRLIPESWK